MKKIFLFFIIINIIFYTNIVHSAKEIVIYADSIDYDSQKNLIARGNVKIISKYELLTSHLVIIKDKTNQIILPTDFQYKDDQDNYYYGSSGEFTSDFEEGMMKDVKIILNDGSRIVGTQVFKKGYIDLIDKGVYSPCESKIKIKNFICPIWQIEGEKIVHDRKNFFIYHKHSKMRIFNIPVYYVPYMITPSPLLKERRSGFLSPTISMNFINAQVAQTIALPYYFAISEDKELLFIPKFNYGAGVDSSQSIVTRYYQLISGGNFSVNFSADTNFEEENNENWLRDASIITNFNNKINEKFTLSFTSAFQTSPTYLRRTDQNNLLNRKNTLTSSFNLDGYNLRKFDDKLHFEITGYQVVRNDEDNKTTPTTFPYIRYNDGTNKYGKINYNQKYSFYNIFRDTATTDHAQNQQKINYNLSTDSLNYKFKSKINFKTELLSQFYKIENKKISNENYSGTYGRIFPMSGIYFETPIINRINNIYIIPKISFVVNGSQPSSNKVSNEESTNNSYSLLNAASLNRYTGSDKLDNSKRVNYGVDVTKNALKLSLSQSYEFDANSNYNQDVGLRDYMSDLLGSITYNGKKNTLGHNFRFNVDQGLIKSQSLALTNNSLLGATEITYTQERVENNSILTTGSERLNLGFTSNKFKKYSAINLSSSFDLIKDDPTNYTASYQYKDECFGINLNFNRSFYADRDLKPQDALTIMFSFKHLGSYASTNLAVSETDKQDIRWETGGKVGGFFN